MNWDVIILVGTILFFAALHQWPPDGRRWEREQRVPVATPDGHPEPVAGEPVSSTPTHSV